MCVDIVIVDDTVFDPNESFLVQLLPLDANVTVVEGPLSETEVLIIDNDGRITHTHTCTHARMHARTHTHTHTHLDYEWLISLL